MSLRAIKPPHETRTRILDAAEELFMQHGFEGTSMRLLTAKAGANLAAVNYHFGSKDALIEAVFRRRLDPMNAERIAELDRLEKDAGGRALTPRADHPRLRRREPAHDRGREGRRAQFHPPARPHLHRPGEARSARSSASSTRRPWSASRPPSSARCRTCRARSSIWRMHFMFGTLAYTLAATDTVQLIAGCKPEDRYDARLLRGRLTAFLSAGLLAPLHDASDVKKAA